MNTNLPKVAYFCMEYGLHEEFEIYSGGLGILAGDYLKSAKDGGYPLVGIGILWRQGFSSQTIDSNGKICDAYHEHKYDFLKDTGVEVKVKIRGKQVRCKVWLCEKYENAPLYLLDTYLPNNNDPFLTGQLYGWFGEERVAQEMILGIGGVKALRALKIDAGVYHFNEGHAAFAGIELIREQMDENGLSFEEAHKLVRGKIVFTTHTPIEAGNETHDHELLKYMGAYNGLTYGQMLRIGSEPFNMTIAGLRLSRKSNAVAKLHGETARKMWKDVEGASEIISITNGVHNATWQDNRIFEAYEKNSNLWDVHFELKKQMLIEVEKLSGTKFDENILTIGFSRRMTPYKRNNFILRNQKIIEELFENNKLQIIFSGKAHPHDIPGKEIIEDLYRMSKLYPKNIVFLQNYDMSIAKILTKGCDIWLNNPIRPMEASGTSGMKAAMNGVLNLSTLDGWWPEGCIHGVNGWQFGDGYEGEEQDKKDLDALYKVLFEEVIPRFYKDKDKWTDMMKASVEMATEKFSAKRMIEKYYRLMY